MPITQNSTKRAKNYNLCTFFLLSFSFFLSFYLSIFLSFLTFFFPSFFLPPLMSKWNMSLSMIEQLTRLANRSQQIKGKSEKKIKENFVNFVNFCLNVATFCQEVMKFSLIFNSTIIVFIVL